jgi:putative tricarboxylic transport membrane protein
MPDATSHVAGVAMIADRLRQNPYLTVSLLSTALAAAMWLLVPYQVDKPVALFGFGSQGLDPKVFPYLVTAVWFAISLWNVVEAWRQTDDEIQAMIGGFTFSVLATIIVSFAYALLLEPLGFVISSAASVIGLALFFGAREWLPIAISAVAVPGVVFVVFTRLLHVSLPPFPDWLMG